MAAIPSVPKNRFVGVVPMTVTPAAADAPTTDVYRARFLAAAHNARVELRLVTPAWAAESLAANTKNNRPLSQVWRKVKGAIERGAWWPNGEAIVFDTAGNLINGQHRLKAIAEAGVAVPCFVVHGIEPEAFATYDQGKKRNPADVLGIAGYENTSMLSSAIGWQKAYAAGQIDTYHARAVANDQVLELAGAYPELCAAVRWAGANYSKLVPPSLMAFLYSRFSDAATPAAADEFLGTRVSKGLGLAEPSWEYALRRRLDGMIGRRDGVSQVEIAALIIKTWNRWVTGQPAPKNPILVWRVADEKFPAIDRDPARPAV